MTNFDKKMRWVYKRVMRGPFFRLPAIAGMIFAVWTGASPANAGPVPIGQTDSFYLQRLREGIRAYQESRYEEASEALEIALFGLAGDKSKLAECLVYAGLSAYHRKNEARSREHILRAESLWEAADGPRPALKEADKILLDKLLAAYKSKAGGAPRQETTTPAWTAPQAKTPAAETPAAKAPVPKSVPVAPPAQKTPAETSRPRPAIAPPPPVAASKPESAPVADLEKRLQAEPGSAALTYDLAAAYLDNGNAAKARRLLEPYLVKQPGDYGAVFLLAKADYRLRRFKPAFEGFHALSSPRVQGELPADTALKAGVYRALCLFHQGDRASLPSALAMASSGVAPAVLEAAVSAEGLSADWAALRKVLAR